MSQVETVKDKNSNATKLRNHFKFRWASFLRLVVSLGLLGLVIYLADLEEFIAGVADVSVIYLIIIALLVYVDRALVVYKWNLLLTIRNIHVPFLHLFSLYSTVVLAGVVLPTTVGGDMFRVYDLKRLNVNVKYSIASIVVERTLGFICMLAIATIGLGIGIYLLSDSWAQFAGISWAIVISILMCAGFVFVIRNENFNQQLNSLAKIHGHRWGLGKIYNVYIQCRDYRNDVGVLLKVTIFTLIRQCVPIFMNVLLVYAYGLDASLLELFAIIPLIVLGSRLPISMDGVGVQEGLYVVLFGLVGVTASQALLMSITFRVMVTLATLPFGVVYFFKYHSKKVIST